MTVRTMFAWGAMVASLALLAACGSDASYDMSGKGAVAIVMSSSGTIASATDGMMASTASHRDDDEGNACRPGQAFQAVKVTFTSILARTTDGRLVDVTIDLPVTVDMLALNSGKEATLPAGLLPPGTYDQIVVVMTTVEVTLQNGTKIAVTPPGGGWTAIVKVAEPFTVVENETTTIKLKFRMDLSFACPLGNLEFHPRFDCDR